MKHKIDSSSGVNVTVNNKVSGATDGAVGKTPCQQAVYIEDLTPFNAEYQLDGFPLMLEDEALEQLTQSMLKHGQLSPIIVDESNNVIDGRSRLNILRYLNKGALIITVKAEDALHFAVNGLRGRSTTVEDMIRLVPWVETHGLKEMPIDFPANTDVRLKIRLWIKHHFAMKRIPSDHHVKEIQEISLIISSIGAKATAYYDKGGENEDPASVTIEFSDETTSKRMDPITGKTIRRKSSLASYLAEFKSDCHQVEAQLDQMIADQISFN